MPALAGFADFNLEKIKKIEPAVGTTFLKLDVIHLRQGYNGQVHPRPA
jgi:hypothetical protein